MAKKKDSHDKITSSLFAAIDSTYPYHSWELGKTSMLMPPESFDGGDTLSRGARPPVGEAVEGRLVAVERGDAGDFFHAVSF